MRLAFQILAFLVVATTLVCCTHRRHRNRHNQLCKRTHLNRRLHPAGEQVVTPAPQFMPFVKLAQKRLAGMAGMKPTREDNLRRLSPDAHDSDSDESDSDPLLYKPFDFEYLKYLKKNPDTDFDRATIKFWQDDAKKNRFTDFDDTW